MSALALAENSASTATWETASGDERRATVFHGRSDYHRVCQSVLRAALLKYEFEAAAPRLRRFSLGRYTSEPYFSLVQQWLRRATPEYRCLYAFAVGGRDPRAVLGAGVQNTTETPGSMEEHLMEPLGRLGRLATLEANWDSYDAEPISHQAIETSRLFLILLARQLYDVVGSAIIPSVAAPIPNGGILLAWHRAESELNLEFSAGGRIGYLLVTAKATSPAFREADGISVSKALELVSRVLLLPNA